MRVGYFVETPVEHNLTGGTRSFLNLIDALIPMGVEPFVVVHEPWALTEELSKRNIPFLTTKMYRPFIGTENVASFPGIKYAIKGMINTVSLFRAADFLRKNKVELIHINSQFTGIVGAQAAKLLGVPYIYHLREFLDADFGVRFYNQKKAYRLIADASEVIAISRDVQREFANRLDRMPQLVYNGIPYDADNFPEHPIMEADTVNLVMLGRLNYAKNQMEAVKAVELLRDRGITNLKLTLVGAVDGDGATEEIKDYIARHDLPVCLIPFTKDPYKHLQSADIGLVCSLREAFGRVTVEYMLSGLLTIGANTGGTLEIIEDGKSGLLYQQGSAEDLADKLERVISDRSLALQLAQAGKKRAMEMFTIPVTAGNIYRIYSGILRGEEK